MYSFINYVSVALEHESFLDNDSCRAIHFVATLNLHFGTTGLGVVHVLLLLSTLCSFLFVPFVAFRAVIAIENVYSRKHNVRFVILRHHRKNCRVLRRQFVFPVYRGLPWKCWKDSFVTAFSIVLLTDTYLFVLS